MSKTPHNSHTVLSRQYHLLVVEDDPLIPSALRMILPPEWKIIPVQSPKDVNFNFHYHAALIDMHIEGGHSANADGGIGANADGGIRAEADGPKVIERLHRQNPFVEIFAMSGELNRDTMEKAIRAGATRFITKPLDPEEILYFLAKVEALVQIREAANNPNPSPMKWIGVSNVAEKARRLIASLRGEPGPILIEAESGCGKEVAARMIHMQETTGQMIPVNLASIPDNLFESELFGHIKGSFTGADSNKIGLIEAAAGGDLFLDEIEALPLHLQPKLLRFLESGEIKKVGAKDSQIIACRVIAASNRDLHAMVHQGEFREDLYWRLSGKKILIPPLRERKEDIEPLTKHFVESARPKRNKTFTEDAILRLQDHSWPGNVRELKRVCEQLCLQSPLPFIRGEDVDAILNLYPAKPGLSSGSEKSSTKQSFDFSQGLTALLAAHEALILRAAFKLCKDIDAAAKLLSVSRSSLYKKLKEYGIDS